MVDVIKILSQHKQPEFFDFPDGQPHVKLKNPPYIEGELRIRASIANPHDLFELALLVDMYRKARKHLEITYLMGGRTDRAMSAVEPFTLRVVCYQINTMKFDTVTVLDPHSVVTPTLLRNCTVRSASAYAEKAAIHCKPDYLVAPDLGAAKRVQEVADANGIPVLHFDKKRDNRGNITGVKWLSPHSLHEAVCLIVDDLCDGGATFTAVSEELRRYGATVNLYVTHGIFSKGLPIKGIDHVYTTDSYPPLDNSALFANTPYLTVYQV